jgi:deazaflavin-dependent oxidoreductase (nitroreductase family)
MPLPRALARFNKSLSNHVLGVFAPYVPGFGIVVHRGRKSGKEYRTPVNVFRADGGYTFALTYGRGDWVQNVIAAGSADLRTRRRCVHVIGPRLFVDKQREEVPKPVALILGLLDVDEFLHVDVDAPPLPASPGTDDDDR